ncbi:hypothetical protein E1161_08660 [Saccharopolyspora aridisoli]|uniref:Uncharacterized protein n=1 Tax=Saccharopolyspora aridisoli TaxID=2530385 RepID=A0A4R4UUA7_9PSEU|nr:hypothetical protein [Saccharopolyspora aridisoli]TDC94066.1 hypothetical protein E1161_08660 [Saccharopolyspora aridisoli]
MSRDSGADQPTQRTVAELLAEYGGSSEKGSRRRRRKAEDPTETAPQEIINRVLSDSGKMRPVKPDEEPPSSRRQAGPAAAPPHAAPASQPPAQPPAAQPPATPPAQPPTAQAPAAQPPAAQPPAKPPQAAGPVSPPSAPPARPAAEPPAESGPKPGSAGYWAQRFGSPGSAASTPLTPSAPSSDAEATIRQPALPTPPARPGPPMAPAGPPQLPENFTEQLPRIDGGADQSYAAQAEPHADPYDYEPFDDSEQSYSGAYEQPYDEDYDQSYDEDYDSSAPAGLNDDYDPDEEADRPPSAGKEWGTLALQGVLGLVGGGAVWVGFRWLWINATIAAFGAALVFTGLLVLVAWKFFRTNDLQTILLSVLVGLFCTVSPAALLLINQ